VLSYLAKAVGLPVLAVSGDEVIDALLRAGFRKLRKEADGHAVIAIGYRSATAAQDGLLAPSELRLVLREAGLSYSDFLELVADVEPSGRPNESYVRLRRCG
jgi:hypothetical protein